MGAMGGRAVNWRVAPEPWRKLNGLCLNLTSFFQRKGLGG